MVAVDAKQALSKLRNLLGASDYDTVEEMLACESSDPAKALSICVMLECSHVRETPGDRVCRVCEKLSMLTCLDLAQFL